MKNSLKTFITGMWVCAFSLSFLFSPANNIRINGTVKVAPGTGDTLVLSFPLRWDNSWRDQFNWDAAWVFLKYKSVTGGWNHVNLCAGGHRFVNGSGLPVPFDAMPGNTGSSTVGLFIYRNTLGAGNTPEITCQVKCLKSSLGNLTPDQFQNHDGFILAQALEMVYVPYGVYALGDGRSSNRFAGGSDGSAVWMDTEAVLNGSSQIKVYPVTNGAVGSVLTIGANYPKGYKGFYVMKYEVSQEQYVSFLNTLTYAQQQERVPGLSTLKEGEFVFGEKVIPDNRNGIIVNVVSNGSRSVVFANNLNNNGEYSEDGDGKTIACNYLSPSDMLAYCSWSGLRPMDELEYEKASRPLYPEEPARGGYAWNTAVLNNALGGVSNGGTRKEVAQGGGNVNSGGDSWRQGPVRCGIFATGSSTQESSGASFWGVMELSGNLREMCYNIGGNGSFNGTVLGDGSYSTNKWSTTPSYIGVRGGSFSGADSLLRTSDRTEADYFSALTVNTHDSTVGFRGVRPIGSDVTVTQGNLVAKAGGASVANVCPGMVVDITTDSPAKVTSGGTTVPNMDFTYIWYVKKPGAALDSIVPGATGAVLSYSDFAVIGSVQTVTYQFRRRAVSPVGEVISGYIALTVPNMALMLSAESATIDACDNSVIVTASAYCSNPVYTWSYGDKWSKTGSAYTPGRGDFSGSVNYVVDCVVSSSGCTSEKKKLAVHVPYVQEFASEDVNLSNCENAIGIDARDGKRYCTVKIGEQCWMGKNLNYSIGITRICYKNQESYCDKYGGLYTWNVAMGGSKIEKAQGICPAGWHIPTQAEWTELIDGLGGLSVAGKAMKIPTACAGCGSSGFGGILAGYAPGSGVPSLENSRGNWWSSTLWSSCGHNFCVNTGDAATTNCYNGGGSLSVRCIKD